MFDKEVQPTVFDCVGRFIDFCRSRCEIENETYTVAEVVTSNGEIIYGGLIKNNSTVYLNNDRVANFQWVGCIKTESSDYDGKPLYYFYTLGAIENDILDNFNHNNENYEAWRKYCDMFKPKKNKENTNDKQT